MSREKVKIIKIITSLVAERSQQVEKSGLDFSTALEVTIF